MFYLLLSTIYLFDFTKNSFYLELDIMFDFMLHVISYQLCVPLAKTKISNSNKI